MSLFSKIEQHHFKKDILVDLDMRRIYNAISVEKFYFLREFTLLHSSTILSVTIFYIEATEFNMKIFIFR